MDLDLPSACARRDAPRAQPHVLTSHISSALQYGEAERFRQLVQRVEGWARQNGHSLDAQEYIEASRLEPEADRKAAGLRFWERYDRTFYALRKAKA